MAAPTYANDLTLLDDCADATGWTEATGMTQTGTPTQETDYYIEGSACVSATFSKTGLGSAVFNAGSGQTIPTDGAFLCWQYFAAPNALANEANGGIRLIIGSGVGDYDAWILGGSDSYQYGGWQCLAVNPTVSADYTQGTPSGSYVYFGWGANVSTAVSKGNPFAVDVIRYGRCEARFTDGDGTSGYCTFAGFAAVNDATSARWGLIQAVDGGYLWQGLMTLGYSTAVDFRDANTQVLVANVKKTTSGFNKIEIRQSGSRVDWTNISFLALGTVSRGALEVIDNADVNFDGCTFTDMDTFAFLANSSVLDCIFRRCLAVTAGGADLTGSQVLSSRVAADASALIWDVATDPDGYLDNMTFSKGTNAHHAVELGTSSPTSVTLRGVNFSGFNASDSQNDSAIYVARTTGSVTINIVGGSGVPSYKSAGATVTIVSNPVTLLVTVKDAGTGSVVVGARVYVVADSGGDLTPGTVIINTTTNASGQASDVRSYTSSQPISGRVRKSTSSPLYKTGPISGTVDKDSGLTITVQMVSDE